MTIDTSKLKRRLPAPPPATEGSPGIERQPERTSVSEPSAPILPDAAQVIASPLRLDGRALRATGRVHQLNVKVSAETKMTVLKIASDRSLLVAEVIEEAVALLDKAGR